MQIIKKHSIYSIFFIGFLLLFSCKKDDITNLRIQDFLLNVNYYGSQDTTILFITNGEDEILFDTIGIWNNKNFKIKKTVDETINVTIGGVLSGRIFLRTYKDVKSGYKLTNTIFCDNPLDQNYSETGNYAIHVKNISKYSKINFPLRIKGTIKSNELENEIIIEGKYIFNSDVVLTIVPENSNNPYSFYIDRDSIKEITPGNFIYSIDFNNFEPSVEHKINLDKFITLRYRIAALSSKGKLVNIATENYDFDIPETNEINFYSLPGLEITDLKLVFSDYYSHGPYTLNKYYKGIPTSIIIYDPVSEFINTTKEKYEIINNFDYDFSNTSISFSIPNKSYQWDIYEKRNSFLKGNIPKLPDFIKSYLDYNEISTPSYIICRFYKLNDQDFIGNYNKTNNVLSLFCREFESKGIWKSL